MLEDRGIDGNAGQIDHAQLAREQWLPHRVSEHFAPIDHIRAASKSRHLFRAANRTVIAVVGDGGAGARGSEVERCAITERQVFSHWELSCRKNARWRRNRDVTQ